MPRTLWEVSFHVIWERETGDEVDMQEEEEDSEETDYLESQLSPNSSTQEIEASTNMETGYLKRFGAVKNINKTIYGLQQSREFLTMANMEVQLGTDRNTGSGIQPAEPDVDYEETLRQSGKTRVSTISKLLGTNRVTPPLLKPLVDNRASMEEASTKNVDIMAEQSEQLSIRTVN